jgi:DNA-binding NtrC family response regulator
VDRYRVLFVDDETEFLETMLDRMRKRNVEVQGAGSGEESLTILRNDRIDVVVLDVKMPGMDGFETLKEIKKQYPLIEVILLTGYASMEGALTGMELGAFDYLLKPMDVDELLYKIHDAWIQKSIKEGTACKFEPSTTGTDGH